MRECKGSDFLHTNRPWCCSELLSVPPFVLRQALFLLQIFYLTHTNFPFPPHPYNVQLSFQTITCGVKHAPQLRFFAKPDFAFVLHFRFAPVQNMAVRICGTNKLLQKILIRWMFQISSEIPSHGFWTEVAGRSPVCFWLLFASLNLQCKCKQKKGWTQKEKSSIMGLTRTQRKDDS